MRLKYIESTIFEAAFEISPLDVRPGNIKRDDDTCYHCKPYLRRRVASFFFPFFCEAIHFLARLVNQENLCLTISTSAELIISYDVGDVGQK